MSEEIPSLLESLPDEVESRREELGESAELHLLATTLEKAKMFATHIDIQAHILIGVSVAIFVFTASQLESGNHESNAFFSILGIFAAAAALIALTGVHPPELVRKRGQQESLLYNLRITDFETPQAYADEVRRVAQNHDAIVDEYATEIYNLYKYYYRPKRQLFNIARTLLFLGIIVSGIVFFVAG